MIRSGLGCAEKRLTDGKLLVIHCLVFILFCLVPFWSESFEESPLERLLRGSGLNEQPFFMMWRRLALIGLAVVKIQHADAVDAHTRTI